MKNMTHVFDDWWLKSLKLFGQLRNLWDASNRSTMDVTELRWDASHLQMSPEMAPEMFPLWRVVQHHFFGIEAPRKWWWNSRSGWWFGTAMWPKLSSSVAVLSWLGRFVHHFSCHDLLSHDFCWGCKPCAAYSGVLGCCLRHGSWQPPYDDSDEWYLALWGTGWCRVWFTHVSPRMSHPAIPGPKGLCLWQNVAPASLHSYVGQLALLGGLVLRAWRAIPGCHRSWMGGCCGGWSLPANGWALRTSLWCSSDLWWLRWPCSTSCHLEAVLWVPAPCCPVSAVNRTYDLETVGDVMMTELVVFLRL